MVHIRIAEEMAKQIENRFDMAGQSRTLLVLRLKERLIEGFSMSDIRTVLNNKCSTRQGKRKPLQVTYALLDTVFPTLLDETVVGITHEEDKAAEERYERQQQRELEEYGYIRGTLN